MKQYNRQALRHILHERLSLTELKAAAFDLECEAEGMEKDEVILELLEYLDNRSGLDKLVDWVKTNRPDIDITTINTASSLPTASSVTLGTPDISSPPSGWQARLRPFAPVVGLVVLILVGAVAFMQLRGARPGAVDSKYAQLKAAGIDLGAPTTDVTPTQDGRGSFRHYRADGPLGLIGASIYWTPDTGAHEVHGAIRDKWLELGGERGFLGYPLTDELIPSDSRARFNHFQGGSIYWTPWTGAHEVHGLIRDKWAELGWEMSFLGYPVTDELSTPDGMGRYNRFQGGSIYWAADKGAYIVK